jgi:hypothetical protein
MSNVWRTDMVVLAVSAVLGVMVGVHVLGARAAAGVFAIGIALVAILSIVGALAERSVIRKTEQHEAS